MRFISRKDTTFRDLCQDLRRLHGVPLESFISFTEYERCGSVKFHRNILILSNLLWKQRIQIFVFNSQFSILNSWTFTPSPHPSQNPSHWQLFRDCETVKAKEAYRKTFTTDYPNLTIRTSETICVNPGNLWWVLMRSRFSQPKPSVQAGKSNALSRAKRWFKLSKRLLCPA